MKLVVTNAKALEILDKMDEMGMDADVDADFLDPDYVLLTFTDEIAFDFANDI